MTEQPPTRVATRDPDKGRTIEVVPYDPQWPGMFLDEVARLRGALGEAICRVEHVGSTSVPGLAAKPVIDIHLTVADSANEAAYSDRLIEAGYVFVHRSPNWHEHRLFKRLAPEVNLHVFTQGCPEVDRCLLFRDWLRVSEADRGLYAGVKHDLAKRKWEHVQQYAEAKQTVIAEIMTRAQAWRDQRT